MRSLRARAVPFLTIVIAIALAGCGEAGRTSSDSTTSDIEISAPVQIAVGSAGTAWLIDIGGRRYLSQPATVVSFSTDGTPQSVAPLQPMALTQSIGIGPSLVVAGSRCVDRSETTAVCQAQGEVRALTDGRWRSYSFDPVDGDTQQNAVSIIGEGPEPGTVWLKVGFSESPPNDGRLRAVEFDVNKMQPVTWVEPSPAFGALCLVDGRLTDSATSRVTPPVVAGGVVPGVNDPISISYQVVTYDGSAWKPAANGTWSGDRPRIETMHCTPKGLSTSIPGSDASVLSWSPESGWSEHAPDPVIAQSGPVPLGYLVNGQQIASIAGRAYVEEAPGAWKQLPAAADASSVPTVALTGGILAACAPTINDIDTQTCKAERLE